MSRGEGAGESRDGARLREEIIDSLVGQGFVMRGSTLIPPVLATKDEIRKLHSSAVQFRQRRAESKYQQKEAILLRKFASGEEVHPERISPVLVEVKRRSPEETLFRYASLHWSVPVSSGYGRRLRYLVVDSFNEKLIGLIGLCDPVYCAPARDKYIGWTDAQRAIHLKEVLEAFVLGAVPPYAQLLGGKLVALLATSNDVRLRFTEKYDSQVSRIAAASHASPVLITTTSALGRSSIYNRLVYEATTIFERVGWTRGWGDIHLNDELYERIFAHAQAYCSPSEKSVAWGGGFRNRREVIRKVLSSLDLPPDWILHGIQREVFAARLAENAGLVLRRDGSSPQPVWRTTRADEVGAYWRDRWATPRAIRRQSWRTFQPESIALWGDHCGPSLPG